MSVKFGSAETKRHYEPRWMPDPARRDERAPFTLNGILVVSGGRSAAVIEVPLDIVAKSKAAAKAELQRWFDQRGKKSTLTCTGEDGSVDPYEDCELIGVQGAPIHAIAWDSELKQGGYRCQPLLIFRQLNVASAPAVPAGGFGA